MSATRTILCTIMVMFVLGCGQVVTEKIHVPQSAQMTSTCVTGNKTILVLPFMDYSNADDIETATKRNMAVIEAITDQLTAKGYRLPVIEDIVKYLSDNQIIKLNSSSSSGSRSNSLNNELLWGEWSAEMRKAIKEQIDLTSRVQRQDLQGLDKKTIAKIGSQFKADYIMRGRIIKYDFRETDDSWNPLKRGLLPIIFPDSTNRFLFGIANPEMYDMLEGLTFGNATRGVVGNAIVHIRVWAQDPATGEVVWTNRAEVKVTPRTSFAGRNVDDLFHTAVNQAIASLIDDFFVKTESYM